MERYIALLGTKGQTEQSSAVSGMFNKNQTNFLKHKRTTVRQEYQEILEQNQTLILKMIFLEHYYNLINDTLIFQKQHSC